MVVVLCNLMILRTSFQTAKAGPRRTLPPSPNPSPTQARPSSGSCSSPAPSAPLSVESFPSAWKHTVMSPSSAPSSLAGCGPVLCPPSQQTPQESLHLLTAVRPLFFSLTPSRQPTETPGDEVLRDPHAVNPRTTSLICLIQWSANSGSLD
uniref:Uncharacterized protein n=1 Tax=Pipistrellus kuhlii TaxID=59472 RepID=A0A7J7VMI8_PIPKU|nr:hypothetical protein mPipKuh1_008392 [Pipistrellus kuhlii]